VECDKDVGEGGSEKKERIEEEGEVNRDEQRE
jgi:hypothetical protein